MTLVHKLIIILLLAISMHLCQRPNTCKTLSDYMTMNPKRCWYNPDLFLNASELITTHGYPLEEYEVTTSDDYILKLFRIPKNNSKGIIFLQHAATTTCTAWIDKGNDSLAFMLWNAGYDIWLPNFRGTFYSRKHKYLDPNEQQYWNFSFHELGAYDIHDQLEFVINTTKPKEKGITLIGFSMGSTAAIVYAVEHPEHAHKWLNVMILFAPSAYVKHMPNFLIQISKSSKDIYSMALNFNLAEIIAHNKFFRNIQNLCRNGSTMLLCLIFDNFTYGVVNTGVAGKYFPMMHTQFPGGISMKCFIHYMQIINSGGKFQKFDYGDKNMEYYHSDKPPSYEVRNMSVPIYIVYADNDYLIPVQDVEYLYDQLPPSAKIYGKLLVNNTNHSYFIYGEYVVDWIYKPLIEFINKIYN